MDSLKCLTIPLICKTELSLPYEVYEDSSMRVTLDSLSRSEIEKAFRIKFVDAANGQYTICPIEPCDLMTDDNMYTYLHDSNLQIRVLPKVEGGITPDIKDRISLAMNCALGIIDSFASWQYTTHSSVQTRLEYRHYHSTSMSHNIIEEHLFNINKILSFNPSDDLPEQKLKTLSALLYSATHQGTSADVSSVLYISILEAIFVKENSELSYRLSMRIAAFFRKDVAYAKNIRRLYTKRGKVIHGSKKGTVFDLEEQKMLEGLAKVSFIKLLENPTLFKTDELDDLLLRF